MAIRAGEVITEFRTEYTGDVRDLQRASSQARQIWLQNEAALLRSQGALSRINALTSGQDYGAKGARAAAASFGDLAGELGLLSRYGGVGGLGIFGGIAAGTVAAARAGVQYREDLDKLSRSLTVLTGSQAQATRLLSEWRELADRTPFQLEDVAQAGRRFIAMGIAAKDTVPYLEATANAVARVGGGKEQIDSVSLALAQVSARGKVSAQEMNQLANALVDGWAPLEKELGKTRGELFKMAEQGEISSATFLRAFMKMYGAGENTAAQMGTITQSVNTLTDRMKFGMAVGFDPVHGALKAIAAEAATTATKGLDVARAFDAMTEAARSFMKLNPSAATTWHVLGMNPIQPGMTFQGEAQLGAINAASAGIEAAQRAEQEEFAKQFEAQVKQLNDQLLNAVRAGGAATEMIRGLQSQFRTLGDDSTVGKVAEQFKLWREEFERMGATAPSGWQATLRAAEQRAVAEARAIDERIKKLQEQKRAEEDARRETERQAGVIRSLTEESQQLAVQISSFNKSAARQEVLMLGLASGALTLDEANRKTADGLLTKIRLQKEEHNLLGQLQGFIVENTNAIGDNESAVSRVNRALSTYLSMLSQQKGVMPVLTDQMRELAERARDAASIRDTLSALSEMGVPGIPTPGPLGVQLPPVGPGPVVGDPGTAPHNIYADRVRAREQHLEIADDITDIYRSTFARIGEGWAGMWNEMGNIARQTLLSISSETIRSMLTGQKSGAGGIIGFFTNHILGAVLGSAFGGASVAGTAGQSFGSNVGAAVAGRIPGRAEGGPVFAGQLYETHGLGREKEFFVPASNGRIYNERQAGQAAPTVGGYVDNRTFNVTMQAPRSTSYVQKRGGRELGDLFMNFIRTRT